MNKYNKHNEPIDEHIVKQFVDECSGRLIDPITIAGAVKTKSGASVEEVLEYLGLSVKDLDARLTVDIEDLDELRTRVIKLEKFYAQVSEFDLDQFKKDLETLLKNYYLSYTSVDLSELIAKIDRLLAKSNGIKDETDPLFKAWKAEFDEFKKLVGDTLVDLDTRVRKLENNISSALMNEWIIDYRAHKDQLICWADVNNDGIIDIKDIQAIANRILGLNSNKTTTRYLNGTAYTRPFGDVTGDGSANSADIAVVVNILAGVETPLSQSSWYVCQGTPDASWFSRRIIYDAIIYAGAVVPVNTNIIIDNDGNIKPNGSGYYYNEVQGNDLLIKVSEDEDGNNVVDYVVQAPAYATYVGNGGNDTDDDDKSDEDKSTDKTVWISNGDKIVGPIKKFNSDKILSKAITDIKSDAVKLDTRIAMLENKEDKDTIFDPEELKNSINEVDAKVDSLEELANTHFHEQSATYVNYRVEMDQIHGIIIQHTEDINKINEKIKDDTIEPKVRDWVIPVIEPLKNDLADTSKDLSDLQTDISTARGGWITIAARLDAADKKDKDNEDLIKDLNTTIDTINDSFDNYETKTGVSTKIATEISNLHLSKYALNTTVDSVLAVAKGASDMVTEHEDKITDLETRTGTVEGDVSAIKKNYVSTSQMEAKLSQFSSNLDKSITDLRDESDGKYALKGTDVITVSGLNLDEDETSEDSDSADVQSVLNVVRRSKAIASLNSQTTDLQEQVDEIKAADFTWDAISSVSLNADVNQDGIINGADIAMVVNVISGLANKADYPLADQNNDGAVNATDIASIVNTIANMGGTTFDDGNIISGKEIKLTSGALAYREVTLGQEELNYAREEDGSLNKEKIADVIYDKFQNTGYYMINYRDVMFTLVAAQVSDGDMTVKQIFSPQPFVMYYNIGKNEFNYFGEINSGSGITRISLSNNE